MPETRTRAPARRIGTRSGRAGSRFLIASLVTVWACAACDGGRTDATVRVIDLLRQADRAEKHPTAGAFEIAEHTLEGATTTSLAVPAPSRMIWILHFPKRAVFNARVAAPEEPPGSVVTFRVGVSDDRIYEGLAQAAIASGDARWTSIAADLSRYAGWKWSLFYHPDGRSWRLVLSVDTNGVTTRALWGAPGIDTDRAAARDFARSRAAVR